MSGTEHLFLYILQDPDSIGVMMLLELDINVKLLHDILVEMVEDSQTNKIRNATESSRYTKFREVLGTTTPALDEHSENMIEFALQRKYDPVIGREEEMREFQEILLRRRKGNPALIGKPGVGKTALVEGLAQLLVLGQVHPDLEGTVIFNLDLTSIVAGTKYRGEFEERLKRILNETRKDQRIVVKIDELHLIASATNPDGAVDAGNLLKPALARGQFRCIGLTTTAEYKKFVQRDQALDRRFQPLEIKETSVPATVKILHGTKNILQQHHGLIYSADSIESAAVLSKKYIRDRCLPDKALDVLDHTAARIRYENIELPDTLTKLLNQMHSVLHHKHNALMQQDFRLAHLCTEKEVQIRLLMRVARQAIIINMQDDFLNIREFIELINENDIAITIGKWTGLPLANLSTSETARLIDMEKILHEKLIGQEQAVSAVARAIRRSRTGFRSENRPIASFIFAGPTGVGKTELTKAVAAYLFKSRSDMIRIDMSEYMEKHTVAKLIGSPPGYIGYNEGGQLTEAVRDKPFSVILLDEVEKAHPDVFNLLLQILDDGRLTDSQGREIDFTNTLIVMTTNLGAKIIERESGIKAKAYTSQMGIRLTINDEAFPNRWMPPENKAQDQAIMEKTEELVNNELKNFFRPEFLNRIDQIIVFSHLTRRDIWDIAVLLIKELTDRLEKTGVKVIVTDEVRALLVEEGYDPVYGARPLRRTVTHYLEDGLAEYCLAKPLKKGTTITVKRKNFQKFREDIANSGRNVQEIRSFMSKLKIRSMRTGEEEHLVSNTDKYRLMFIERPISAIKEFSSPFKGSEANIYSNQVYFILETGGPQTTKDYKNEHLRISKNLSLKRTQRNRFLARKAANLLNKEKINKNHFDDLDDTKPFQ